MQIKIRYKVIKNGMLSIFLDIHFFGNRRSEFLNLKVKEKPITSKDRIWKKEAQLIAEQIVIERRKEYIEGQYNIKSILKKRIDFIKFSEDYIEAQRNQIYYRGYSAAIQKLKKFIKSEHLFCDHINETLIQKYANYLDDNLKGLTPETYLKKIKRLIKVAKEAKLINFEFTKPIKLKPNTKAKKDVLTFEEAKILIDAYCGNEQVKKAFIIAFLTGLRYCDLVALKWLHIKGNKIVITQQKTNIPVTVTLNEDAKFFLGERRDATQNVFNLPSHTGSLKSLRLWVKNAGIDKHITWHCGRHSFGTNLVEAGADIYSVSNLLGHTSVKYTSIYLRFSDKMAQAALEKLPTLINQKNIKNG